MLKKQYFRLSVNTINDICLLIVHNSHARFCHQIRLFFIFIHKKTILCILHARTSEYIHFLCNKVAFRRPYSYQKFYSFSVLFFALVSLIYHGKYERTNSTVIAATITSNLRIKLGGNISRIEGVSSGRAINK